MSIESVDLTTVKAVIAVKTASSTVGYVDTRGEHPMVMRARGAGNTHDADWDRVWLFLRGMVSFPVGLEYPQVGIDGDYNYTQIRVGARHSYFLSDRPPRRQVQLADFRPRFSQAATWTQRMVTELELLEELPPVGEQSRTEGEVDFTDGPEPGSSFSR